MTGIVNKTARQLDLRGRDMSGIVHVTLNPGFNIVDDETWKVLSENKHVGILIDGGAIVAGTKKSKEEADAERELAERQAAGDANTLVPPENPAAVVKTADKAKDPNAPKLTTKDKNPETGKNYTKAELTALQSDDSLSLE